MGFFLPSSFMFPSVRIASHGIVTAAAAVKGAAPFAKNSFSRGIQTTAVAAPGNKTDGSGPLPVHHFPLPHLHVGTDICHVGRIYGILKKHNRPPSKKSSSSSSSSSSPSPSSVARFVRRILTDEELPPPPTTTTSSPVNPLPPNASSWQTLAWVMSGRPVPGMKTKDDNDDGDGDDKDPRLWKLARFLAGRFAAKEAAIKAHPRLDLSFHRVRIGRTSLDENNGSGPPVALIRVEKGDGETTQTNGQQTLSAAYDQEALLSISHDGDYATAVCIGFDQTATVPKRLL